MKKLISLVLAVVLILAMTVPALAATADEAAPCATPCTGSHTKGTYLGYNEEYQKEGEKCLYILTQHYQCSVCHTVFFDTKTTVYSHNKEQNDSNCDGITRTWTYKCKNCKGLFETKSACPGAGHIPGNCSWLPF